MAPRFIDVVLPAGTKLREIVPSTHTCFAYVDQGAVGLGANKSAVTSPALVIFGPGDIVWASGGNTGGRFIRQEPTDAPG